MPQEAGRPLTRTDGQLTASSGRTRDSFGVDHDWLLLPPSEIAMHPGEREMHELFLMTDDVKKTVSDLKAKGVKCEPVKDQGWGLLTRLKLPGGSSLGLYQPKHAQP